MKRAIINYDNEGNPFTSPQEGGILKRSYINYIYGISELDEELKGKVLPPTVDFYMAVFKTMVQFSLYIRSEELWNFQILKENILEVRRLSNQDLLLKKDPRYMGNTLRTIAGTGGILGGVLAGVLDSLITTNKNQIPQVTKGTIFEIIVQSETGETEKILISCSDNKSEKVQIFLNRIFEKNKGGCFIATACYGDFDAPEVVKFREYRDQQMNRTFIGRTFIRFYYKISPSIARRLTTKSKEANFIKNFFLDPIYRSLNK